MSFLGNLARYVPSPGKTQTENLLTEWLAESLRSAKPFFEALICQRLGQSLSFEKTNIHTQVGIRVPKTSDNTSTAGILDLRIQDPHHLIIVEVKWGAPESGDVYIQ